MPGAVTAVSPTRFAIIDELARQFDDAGMKVYLPCCVLRLRRLSIVQCCAFCSMLIGDPRPAAHAAQAIVKGRANEGLAGRRLFPARTPDRGC